MNEGATTPVSTLSHSLLPPLAPTALLDVCSSFVSRYGFLSTRRCWSLSPTRCKKEARYHELLQVVGGELVEVPRADLALMNHAMHRLRGARGCEYGWGWVGGVACVR